MLDNTNLAPSIASTSKALQLLARHGGVVLKALTSVGVTMVAVQGISFLANLIVVRFLSLSEYAILTSTLSIIGMLGAMADSGLAQAALTVGGMHHDSAVEQAQVLRRCRLLILRTGGAASLVVVPVWFFMTQHLGGTKWGLIGTAGVLFGGFFVSLGLNIFKSFLLLEGRRVMLQKLDVIKTVFRVALLFAGIWYFPSATYVIACASLVEAGAWWYCRHALAHLTVLDVEPSPAINRQVAAIFWRLMPVFIYRATSSQLFLLLLVAFGTTGGVAGAGALGRFQQFYVVVTTLSATIFAPRVARTIGIAARSRLLVAYTACGWLAAVLVCVSLMALAPLLLECFGAAYAGLASELRIFVVACCLYSMNGVLGGIMNARGWVLPSMLVIGVDLCSSVFAIMVCDVSTLQGFVWMSCIVNGTCLLVAVGWVTFGLLTGRGEDCFR